MKLKKRSNGQAVIEYLMIFSFMALFGVKLLQGLGTTLDETISSLAFTLTQQLSIGVCDSTCFYTGYANQ